MPRSRKMVWLLSSSVLLLLPMEVSPQSQQPPRTAVPGFYGDIDKNAAAMRRGEATFYQRCSLCHLPRIRKPATTPGPAPSLNGILKDVNRDKEGAVRDYIRTGSDKMPAWQYSLKSEQMDDLIAYLKTL